MDIEVERNQLIAQLKKVDDIDVINAVKNILSIASRKEKVYEFMVSEEQKEMVRSRVKSYEENPENVISWNDIQRKIRLDK